MIIDLDDVHSDLTETADVCIIGSGAGGAAVARELTAAGASVIMLEEGAYYRRADFNRRLDHMIPLLYRDLGLTTALGFPSIPVPLGKTVGGTTTINSGTCFRAPRPLLDGWERDLGVAGVGGGALDPYYEKVEERLHVQPVKEDLLGKNAELVRRGARALGLHSEPLRRAVTDNCRGCGVCCFGCPSDAKMSVNLSYIPAALERGLRLFTRCLALRLLVENGRVAGVEAGFVRRTQDRPERFLRVRARTVVLAAGAIYSPLFLLSHRLGRARGQVGRNLSLHPCSRVTALFDETVEGWKGVPQGFCVDTLRDEGVMLEGIQGPPALLGPLLPFSGRRYQELVEAAPRLAAFGVMIKDSTRGRVRRLPGRRPLVTYFMNRDDFGRVLRGIGLLVKIFFAAGARKVFPPLHSLPEVSSPEEFERRLDPDQSPADLEGMAFHPLGTCRMGGDPSRSVVDPEGECRDLPGLYVADGSVLPSALGVNPQMTIMAVAARIGERLARRGA
ncbi:MAG: GMC family oxidoreductase [Planctomycetes bacterium]|nr:GMC family oxidoreductase [Planctomycetota bacterium]